MALTLRKIETRDCEAIFSWVAGLGWNPGVKDGECLLATDPDGMRVAELNGQPVGCATSIAYSETYGFVGSLVVDPALRGKAHSFMLQMYRQLSDYMGRRNVGMDAMPTTESFFKAVGCTTAYRHARFEGPLAPAKTPRSIVPLLDIPFEAICNYDASCFPARREKFLRLWLDSYGHGGFACLRQGHLAGWGVLRQALRGFRIGPLLADDAEAAEDLLHAMASMTGREFISLDVPEPNTAALALAKKVGLAKSFDTARMYRHSVPIIPLQFIFGIASYEFG